MSGDSSYKHPPPNTVSELQLTSLLFCLKTHQLRQQEVSCCQTHTHTIWHLCMLWRWGSVITPDRKTMCIYKSGPCWQAWALFLCCVDSCALTPEVRLDNQCQSSITNVTSIKDTNWKSLTMDWNKWLKPFMVLLMPDEVGIARKNLDMISRLIHQWSYFQFYLVENITPFKPWAH